MTYETTYDATVRVTATEEEAREAFEEYGDDFAWTSFEESKVEAAELACRLKLSLGQDEDVEVLEHRSTGVQEVTDE